MASFFVILCVCSDPVALPYKPQVLPLIHVTKGIFSSLSGTTLKELHTLQLPNHTAFIPSALYAAVYIPIHDLMLPDSCQIIYTSVGIINEF
jgi:hypothetical protein